MRILAILVSIVILVLVCLGAAAWWVAEPMRFAGVEPNQSRRPVQGALVELSNPGITRREIVEMLQAGDFTSLTRIIESRNERALADVQEEWELGRVVDAFSITDDGLESLFDDWIQEQPESYAPLLASAQYRFSLAYLMRGKRFAAQTTSGAV